MNKRSFAAFLTVLCCSILRAQDLSVFKHSASPTSPLAGATYNYVITVNNSGGSAATNVTVTDVLPPGITFVSGTFPGGTCTENYGTVSCPVGSTTNGANVTVTITVTAGAAGTVVNLAGVIGSSFDSVISNNSLALTTTIAAA